MTGLDIFKRALSELCLEDTNASVKNRVPESALCTVNDIGSDLVSGFHIDSIFDEVDVSEDIIPAFTYGVAMLTAALYGLDNKHDLFLELYSVKRAAVKSGRGRVKNVIPAV